MQVPGYSSRNVLVSAVLLGSRKGHSHTSSRRPRSALMMLRAHGGLEMNCGRLWMSLNLCWCQCCFWHFLHFYSLKGDQPKTSKNRNDFLLAPNELLLSSPSVQWYKEQTLMDLAIRSLREIHANSISHISVWIQEKINTAHLGPKNILVTRSWLVNLWECLGSGLWHS